VVKLIVFAGTETLSVIEDWSRFEKITSDECILQSNVANNIRIEQFVEKKRWTENWIYFSIIADWWAVSDKKRGRGSTGRTADIRLNSLWGKTNDGINFFKDNWSIWHNARPNIGVVFSRCKIAKKPPA
jgi:hypothetical protein